MDIGGEVLCGECPCRAAQMHYVKEVSVNMADKLCPSRQVSQFTLLAKTKKGTKPDFHGAANPDDAMRLYQHFVQQVKAGYEADRVKDGKFQAMMEVALVNDGPVRMRQRGRPSRSACREVPCFPFSRPLRLTFGLGHSRTTGRSEGFGRVRVAMGAKHLHNVVHGTEGGGIDHRPAGSAETRARDVLTIQCQNADSAAFFALGQRLFRRASRPSLYKHHHSIVSGHRRFPRGASAAQHPNASLFSCCHISRTAMQWPVPFAV
jgi:hypothetical protein